MLKITFWTSSILGGLVSILLSSSVTREGMVSRISSSSTEPWEESNVWNKLRASCHTETSSEFGSRCLFSIFLRKAEVFQGYSWPNLTPFSYQQGTGEWLPVIKHRLIRADQKKQGLDYQILDTIFLEMESHLTVRKGALGPLASPFFLHLSFLLAYL